MQGPAPSWFSKHIGDGGLLIVSRLPIVYSDYHVFDYPAVHSDYGALKGCLYAKIDLGPLGGSHLHLFNTHTQASYSELVLEQYVETYVARYEQLKEVKQAVKRLVFDRDSTAFDRAKDVVVVAGDFN